MNAKLSDLVSFAAKCFIVGFTFYLVATALFLRDIRKMNALAESMQNNLKQQEELLFLNKSELFFQQAMAEEKQGAMGPAVQKVVLAFQLAEQNRTKYIEKLKEYSARGLINLPK